MNIPNKVFNEPLPNYNVIGLEEINEANKVLKSGKLSGFIANPGDQFFGGEFVLKLEDAFNKKFNTKVSVSFNSATSALHSALIAGNIKPEDEVIVPTWSMSATATSVLMAGAKPVFCDIEPDCFCIDAHKLKSLITKKTKAVIAVNLFGLPAALNEIREICSNYSLLMIEDNAQCPGGILNSKSTGTYGDISIFSLNRHKTIQCGEGGMAITNNEHYGHRLQMVRNHGEAVFADFDKESKKKGGDDIIGYNYRLTEIQSAIAFPQIKKLDELNQHRIDLAAYLDILLSEFDFLRKPTIREGAKHVYYLYPILFNSSKSKISRDDFLNKMLLEGAPVSNYVTPLYRIPLYSKHYKNSINCDPKNFPVTEDLWKNKLILTSICRPPLTKNHIDLFHKSIKKVLKTVL